MLEISLVRGARALGFVAKHISNAGEPDGIARLVSYPDGERRITLEAKSSTGTPSLSQLDFAGLAEHVRKYDAAGCLLLAPQYPGDLRGDDSAASQRAKAGKISCWTISQFAEVVEKAEARHITAEEIVAIVESKFTPAEVTAAVETLLNDPVRDKQLLYRAILGHLRALEGKATKSPRSIDMLLGRMVDTPGFEAVQFDDIKRAVIELVGASRGVLQMSGTGDSVRVLAGLDEVERRVGALLGGTSVPRMRGPFRADNRGDEDDEDVAER